jgi:uncharacterized protein YndB with AHSA1/START domain
VTAIISDTEIARPPDAVFSYVTDPSQFSEWQRDVVRGHIEGGGPIGVGTRCTTVRRIGGAERTATAEITQLDPPRTWAARGIDGPIRAIVNVTVEPLGRGDRSRVTKHLDFDGHGIGRLLVPLFVRRRAEKELPTNMLSLKEHLERGG